MVESRALIKPSSSTTTTNPSSSSSIASSTAADGAVAVVALVVVVVRLLLLLLVWMMLLIFVVGRREVGQHRRGRVGEGLMKRGRRSLFFSHHCSLLFLLRVVRACIQTVALKEHPMLLLLLVCVCV